MVLNNAKNIVKQVLSSGDTKGLLEARDVGGNTRYIADFSAYPAVVEDTFTLTAANAGISVGSGSTAPTATDYQLGSTITSGLSGSVTTAQSVDNSGNTSITFTLTLTNTSESSISISEIGYKQEIAAADSASGTTATDRVFLLDRSTFDTITLAAGDEAIIDYTIKAVVTNNGGAEGTKTITANGTYNAVTDNLDGYSTVTVNVSPNVGTKSITQNGTYTASTESLDGYSEVTVNVSPNVGTKSITANGTYNASSDSLDGYSQVVVNVSGGGGKTQINPFPQGASTIMLYNSNGIAVNSSSINASGTGEMDFDEYSAGYEGFVIELNVTSGKTYKVEFDYQNIDAQFFVGAYMIGWLLENTARTAYDQYTTWSNDIPRDADLHHHEKVILAAGNKIYMNFNVCGYSDSYRNNIKITNLKVYEYNE